MPNVMPSQVVHVIENLFPHIKHSPGTRVNIMAQHLDRLMAVVNLIREVPPDLLNVSGHEYADLVLGIAIIEENQKIKISRGGGDFGVAHVNASENVADVLYRVMSKCPDEVIPQSSHELHFILDHDVRDGLRRDIGAVDRALSHREWKAANILSGAAIEALLHWKLRTGTPDQNTIDVAIQKLKANGTFGTEPPRDRDDWNLHHFIEVCGETNILRMNTILAARICRKYRNLIHPGAVVRTGEICNHGTALVAAGALSNVISDLERVSAP